MTRSPPPAGHPPSGAHLVEQDILLAREQTQDGTQRVIARVHCARRGCSMDVEDCAGCAHFARIETHEAGYVLLCHAEEETNAVENPQILQESAEDL